MSDITPKPTQIVETTKEEKVFQLTVELHDTKQLKKDSNKAYNEEIKRIQEEIDELLEDDVKTEKTTDK
jgi:uncharacterized membrane protein YfhO